MRWSYKNKGKIYFSNHLPKLHFTLESSKRTIDHLKLEFCFNISFLSIFSVRYEKFIVKKKSSLFLPIKHMTDG